MQAIPSVGDELFLHHGVLSAQGDGILVVCVPFSKGDFSLLAQVLNCLGKVCLNERDHSFLLGIEALKSLNFTCKVQEIKFYHR